MLKAITISHKFFEILRFFLCVNRRYSKSSNRFSNNAISNKFNNNAISNKFNNNAINNKFNNNAIVEIITNEINETFNETFNKKSQFAFTSFFILISFRSDY